MKNPDEILKEIKDAEKTAKHGKLKIFFGMCAGVGKTYSMLLHGKELVKSGNNLLVGYIETHGRQETSELLDGLEILPRKTVLYKGFEFEEFDLERAIELKPEYILVDELAHSNMPGSKHNKRYQDVIELLENGINVLTTVNVQHIESRSKTVEQITGIPIQETVPDSIIELAENIELIDLPIEELLKRLSDGKVYVPDKAKIASNNFFKSGNLISLREMALRFTAEKVESDLVDYMSVKNIEGPWKAGDKLMVAVGTGPFSAELIRWTRRMAYALKSQWYAVYVRTSIKDNEKSTAQLEKNLRLAKELGAEVITSADTDMVDGLLQIARRNNISQIIIGKPDKYNIFNYLRKDNYIDRLIIESGNIDIYIVRPVQVKNSEVKKQRKILFSTSLREYIVSGLSVAVLASICFPFKDYVGYQSVGLILLLNLLILPFYVGRGAILVSAVFNFLIWDFFFIPPVFTFEIAKLHDFLTLLLNLVIAVTSGFLSTKIRKQKQLVQKREKNTLALLNFTRELSNCKDKLDAISIALKHININFNVIATFLDENFIPKVSSSEFLQFDSKEILIAKWSLEHNSIAGKFTNNLPLAQGQYYPVLTKRRKLGVICLISDYKLQIEDENLINNIITQLAGVYEKEENDEQIQQMQIDSESKKLYDTILDSISHEFRTPIAVISGSATSLLEENITDNHELVTNFANEIYIASKRLNILVENLLDITRLESGKLKLNKQPHSIHDIIREVIGQLKDNGNKHNVILNLSSPNAIVNVDYGFISQAIFNILHNSFSYTPDDSIITVTTTEIDNKLQISIADNGNGLIDEDLKKLFQKFYRPKGTKAGGIGLGLSIAKGFIEAHGGRISVRHNEPSGLVFDIILSL